MNKKVSFFVFLVVGHGMMFGGRCMMYDVGR
jgi:hypothetical protein